MTLFPLPCPAKTKTHAKLVWSEEFNGPDPAPNPSNWTYETGGGGWGNRELETYCAYGSNTAPCDSAHPNAVVGKDGYLHIVAREVSPGVYTSAGMTTQGLQSFQYGRIEARIKIPEGQGFWPAFWMLGDNVSTAHWPACGEFDIMENIGKTPSTVYGSIHGTGFTGHSITHRDSLPSGAALGDAFHIYGMLWSPRKVQFYLDSPANIYATLTPSSLPTGAVWPFDDGKFFFLLNLAVGGAWPGNPDTTTRLPAEMLVDSIRVYALPAATR
jgi:beta-glucanase (GH16 family)